MTEDREIDSIALTDFNTVGFGNVEPEMLFVAFIDILGFGQRVLTDFDSARKNYNTLVDHIGLMNATNMFAVTIRMFSDSVYLASKDPSAVIEAAHWVQHGALWCCNWLVRGFIAAGRHQELNSENNLYVVSEPLVLAVNGEKSLKKPCIAIHPTALPRQFIFNGAASNFERVFLFYDGEWIVNPFNLLWGTSPADRVKELKSMYPEHSDKYDWFLGLYDAVRSQSLLLPDYLAEEGIKLREKAKKQ